MIRHRNATGWSRWVWFMALVLGVGCDAGNDNQGGTAGGARSSGGASGSGGDHGPGGTTSSSGSPGQGGSSSAGGSSGAAGTTGTAGTGAGGASSTGGSTVTSGSRDSGSPGDASPDGSPTRGDSGAPAVRLEGRFDFADATKPAFGWSGSAMIARFQGTGASLRLDGSPNQFAVVVDGVLSPSILKTTGSTKQYAVASGLSAGVHDLVIWRRTEGNQGENRFLGLDIVDGQLLAPPAAPDRRIEIYGDSISAGYGLDGPGRDCPWSPDTENHYLTYGAITARDLSAELHTVAWSGIGMYRNYGSAGPSAEAMPQVYARTLPSQAASTWDFAAWQPHAVIINLGTNDVSTKGDPGQPYATAYLGFLRTLRQKYPNTFFVLTVGPMLDGTGLTAIKGHIQKVIKARGAEGDTKMSFLEFPVQVEADGYGCDWHPSAATNAKMAKLLEAELKTRLGW